MNTIKKNKNSGFFQNDLISDSEKGKRKHDGSGKGTRANQGRGGCSPEEQKKKDHRRGFSENTSTEKVKKDNPFFYDYSEDFSDDGNIFIKDKSMTKNQILITLADAWETYLHSEDPEERKRAHKLYMELLAYAEGDSDFTDDRGYPVCTRLITLMDQIYSLVVRQEVRLCKELERASESNDPIHSRVHDHRFIKEFRIDLIP